MKGVVKIKDSAGFVIAHCAEGYTTNLTAEDFFAEDSILAYRLNGKELSREQGYPLRLVVPRLYFWKSAKWVNGIEFSATDRRGTGSRGATTTTGILGRKRGSAIETR